MRDEDAGRARGRASEYTPYGDSNRSTSEKPVKAVIFDIGDVVTRPKYGWAYKRAMRKLDGALSKVAGEDNPLRAAVIRQRRAYMLNDDVMALIQKLHSNGYLTPSITNTPSERFAWDDRLSDGRPFDGVVDSSKVGLRKPDRRIYELALRRFKLQPEECVFVDDKEENLAPAAEMGMRTVLFRNARQLKEELRKLGVRVG